MGIYWQGVYVGERVFVHIFFGRGKGRRGRRMKNACMCASVVTRQRHKEQEKQAANDKSAKRRKERIECREEDRW
jgi:hypothetical protein